MFAYSFNQGVQYFAFRPTTCSFMIFNFVREEVIRMKSDVITESLTLLCLAVLNLEGFLLSAKHVVQSVSLLSPQPSPPLAPRRVGGWHEETADTSDHNTDVVNFIHQPGSLDVIAPTFFFPSSTIPKQD